MIGVGERRGVGCGVSAGRGGVAFEPPAVFAGAADGVDACDGAGVGCDVDATVAVGTGADSTA